MKLITEQTFEGIDILTEKNTDTGEKQMFIHGVFMQSNIKNRNGRIYEDKILRPVLETYKKTKINTGRALGELEHRASPSINLDRVSHRITNLEWKGDDIVGKALILNTPTGNIVRGLLEGGSNIGVSSRGMGSLEERESGDTYVKSDFALTTVDIVSDPSAPTAFVNGILEGINFVYDDSGSIIQLDEIEKIAEKRIKRQRAHVNESALLKNLRKFLLNL